jgi:hypothetical protein
MSDWDGVKERREDYPHRAEDLGWVKKGVVGLAVGLSLHFIVGIFGAAYFGGVVTTKLEYLAMSMEEMKTSIRIDRYTKSEAIIDKQAIDHRFGRNEKTIEDNSKRIAENEKRFYSK